MQNMLTFSLGQDGERLKESILQLLRESENIRIMIERKCDLVVIFKGKEIGQVVSLEEKIKEIVEEIFWDKRGILYQAVISEVEKSLIEFLLGYTGGNKSRSAKILGINRNTLETKIKKLEIPVLKFKR